MKKHLIVTLAIAMFSVNVLAVLLPGAPARNAYVFKKSFEDKHNQNDASRLAANEKHKAKIAKNSNSNDGIIDIELASNEKNRDNKINPGTLNNLLAINTVTADLGSGNPPVVVAVVDVPPIIPPVVDVPPIIPPVVDVPPIIPPVVIIPPPIEPPVVIIPPPIIPPVIPPVEPPHDHGNHGNGDNGHHGDGNSGHNGDHGDNGHNGDGNNGDNGNHGEGNNGKGT